MVDRKEDQIMPTTIYVSLRAYAAEPTGLSIKLFNGATLLNTGGDVGTHIGNGYFSFSIAETLAAIDYDVVIEKNGIGVEDGVLFAGQTVVGVENVVDAVWAKDLNQDAYTGQVRAAGRLVFEAGTAALGIVELEAPVLLSSTSMDVLLEAIEESASAGGDATLDKQNEILTKLTALQSIFAGIDKLVKWLRK